MDGAAHPGATSVPWLLLAAATAFTLLAYHGEATVRAPDLNDHVLHFGLIVRANETWQAGGNPRDAWIPYWGLGFPLLRYYQHGSHLAVVFVFRLMRGIIPLYDVFKAFHLGLLVVAPASVFLGARLLGFTRLTAGFAALSMSALAAEPEERYFLGFQAQTYTWFGFGLFPQLAGMVLFAPAIGAVHRAVLERRRFGLALLLLSATWLCHLVLGYMACLLGALAVFRPEARKRRLRVAKDLAGLYAATFLVASYIVLPSLLESGLLHRSVWEKAEYWDSFGHERVLRALVAGDLLDGDRLPVLTALALVGAILAATTATVIEERGAGRFAVLAFCLAIALYFGRPTWGALLKALPLSDYLPMHRWICAVQYCGVLLSGVALAWFWRLSCRGPALRGTVVATLLTASLLGPALRSSWTSSQVEADVLRRAEHAYRRHGKGITELLWDVHRRDLEHPGRAYAGRGWDWGKDYTLGFTPVYMLWSAYGIAAIGHMFQMSLNSDLEAEFDPRRKDHHDLFNVRYLFHRDKSRLPPFAGVYASGPGVYAATVETPGYFDVVGADLFYAGQGRDLLELNRHFISGHLHGSRRFVQIGVTSGDRPRADQRALEDPTDLHAASKEAWRPPSGTVLQSWGHDDRFGARVRLDDPAHILFRMTYHPNWQAFVDGEPRTSVMLSPSFIGIPVGRGAHRVEMRYVSTGWTTVLFYVGVCVVGLGLLTDRLALWPGDAREGRRHDRVLFEAASLIACVGTLAVLANAPIAEERLPHSPADHARRLAMFEEGGG
jgi:hypothetical protein